MYRVLTTVILAAHFAFLAYVVLGGFLAWRWRRAIWPHLGAAAWGLVIVTNPWGWRCPLTDAEHWARRRAGQAGFDAGFIDRYLEGVLYPAQYTRLLQVLVGVLVAVSWAGWYVRWRARRPGAGGDTAAKSRDSSKRPATV